MKIDVQYASDIPDLPSECELTQWVEVLNDLSLPDSEMVLRIVDLDEMTQLNETYRHKSGPTNVLSFPFDGHPDVSLPLLGDVVICAPVVLQEAAQQGKPALSHWAHMVIHGGLHLLGYDHVLEQQAVRMEALEAKLLSQLGIANPYQ